MSLVYAILSSFFLRQIYWHIPVKMELWSSIVVSLCRLQFSLDNLYLVLASSGLECMDGCMDRWIDAIIHKVYTKMFLYIRWPDIFGFCETNTMNNSVSTIFKKLFRSCLGAIKNPESSSLVFVEKTKSRREQFLGFYFY